MAETRRSLSGRGLSDLKLAITSFQGSLWTYKSSAPTSEVMVSNEVLRREQHGGCHCDVDRLRSGSGRDTKEVQNGYGSHALNHFYSLRISCCFEDILGATVWIPGSKALALVLKWKEIMEVYRIPAAACPELCLELPDVCHGATSGWKELQPGRKSESGM